MDNLLEILVPLIFAAIYFFGNMLSGKSNGEDTPSGVPRRREPDDEATEAAERQRKIQEEIRRKIMERRRASEGQGPPQLAPSGNQLNERQRESPAQRQTREVRKETPEMVHESAEVSPPPFAAPTHHRAEEPTPPAFSWEESDNAYETAMQDRLKQIEETKRRAEQLKRQAESAHKRTESGYTAKRSRGGRYFAGPVRESLKDPAAARVAFIYGEVLGQPISQRKGSSSVPGLS